MILHRVDEKRPERLLIFELRNGPKSLPKPFYARAQGWVEAILTLPTLMRQQDQLPQDAERLARPIRSFA
jgi:hypothetical protein